MLAHRWIKISELKEIDRKSCYNSQLLLTHSKSLLRCINLLPFSEFIFLSIIKMSQKGTKGWWSSSLSLSHTHTHTCTQKNRIYFVQWTVESAYAQNFVLKLEFLCLVHVIGCTYFIHRYQSLWFYLSSLDCVLCKIFWFILFFCLAYRASNLAI